jgi:polyisoprenoid-binding protein YceI
MLTAADRTASKPSSDARPALSGRWRVDPEASHARFVAGTLAGLVKTPGLFRSLSGSLVVGEADATGALLIESASIDTGNRMRDRHLRSRGFFDVKRHPLLRYEARAISSQAPGKARIDGELIVADTWMPLALDLTLHAPAEGAIVLACQTEVDRVGLGIRGARGMVPRAVALDVAITLRRATA